MIRCFEEKVLELTREGEVAGSVHLCLGQDATIAVVSEAKRGRSWWLLQS